jgi:VWFA-related protein
MAPQKDDNQMPQVPQTAAEKAAQQNTGAPAAGAMPQTTNPAIPGASPQTPANTITRNVRLVVLDMVVVDSKGRAVSDLRRDEFHVTESDEPQEIRNFETPGKYTPDPNITIDSTAALDRLAPRAPVNIVLLDEFNTRFEDMAFARYSLEKWLKKQPDKLDTPTMLIAVSLSKFDVLRDYTQNKADILSALDHHFVAYPWQAHNFSWVAERYSTAFLALRRVAEASNGHFGHKNMIWIGRGFPAVGRGRFSVDDENRLNSVIQQTVNELRDARITLYTIDPAGVMVDPGAYGEDARLWAPFGGNPDFQDLARATGGRNLYGRNDVDAEIGTSIRDGASIYTLTYRPTDADRDLRKFRRIKVTVDRPGLTVVTRQGYFLERGPQRVRPNGAASNKLVQELIGAETSNMVYDAVQFSVQPKPNVYTVTVDAKSVVWTFATDTHPRQAKIVLMVSTFDKKGKELKRDARVVTFNAPTTVPPTGRIERGVQIPYTMDGNPKATRARFVVRMDATGRMGTADVTLGQKTAVQSMPASPDANTPVKPVP